MLRQSPCAFTDFVTKRAGNRLVHIFCWGFTVRWFIWCMRWYSCSIHHSLFIFLPKQTIKQTSVKIWQTSVEDRATVHSCFSAVFYTRVVSISVGTSQHSWWCASIGGFIWTTEVEIGYSVLQWCCIWSPSISIILCTNSLQLFYTKTWFRTCWKVFALWNRYFVFLCCLGSYCRNTAKKLDPCGLDLAWSSADRLIQGSSLWFFCPTW